MAEIITILGVLVGLAQQLIGKQDSAAMAALDVVQAVMAGASISLKTLREVEAAIRLMVEEDRGPTKAEWALLKTRSDTLHDAIQGVDLG